MLRDYPEARLVTRAQELVEEAGRLGELAARPRAAEGIRDQLPELLTDVLEAVPAGRWQQAGQIADAAGRAPETTAQVLAALCDHGLVEQSPDGFRVTALGRRPAATVDEPTPALPPRVPADGEDPCGLGPPAGSAGPARSAAP
jgi:DNA processing protein